MTFPDLEITTIKILINSLITRWISLYREFFHFNYCEIIPNVFPPMAFFISVRWDCPPLLIFHFQVNKYWGETHSGSRCTQRGISALVSLYPSILPLLSSSALTLAYISLKSKDTDSSYCRLHKGGKLKTNIKTERERERQNDKQRWIETDGQSGRTMGNDEGIWRLKKRMGEV